MQTITNLIPLTCYLPTNEQCIIYKNKLIRRASLFERKRIQNSEIFNIINNSSQYANENLMSYDEVMMAYGSTSNSKSLITTPSDFIVKQTDDLNNVSSNSYNKRRNAFLSDENPLVPFEEDEDELDFGNATNKMVKQKEKSALDENENSSNGMLKRRFSDELTKSVDNIHLKTTKRNDIQDDMSISSPQPLTIVEAPVAPSSLSSTSTLNIKDIEIDATSSNLQQQQQQDHPHRIYRVNEHHAIDMETSLDEGIGSGSSLNHVKNSPSSLDNLRGSPDTNLNEIDDTDSELLSNKFEHNLATNIFDDGAVSISVEVIGENDDNESDAVDNLSTNNDHYGPYSQSFNNNTDLTIKNSHFQECEDWDRELELNTLKKADYTTVPTNPSGFLKKMFFLLNK